MKEKPILTRRQFLIGASAALGGLALAEIYQLLASANILLNEKIFIPIVVSNASPTPEPTDTPTITPTSSYPTHTPTARPTRTPTPTGSPTHHPTQPPPEGSGRVVHIRHANATNWDGNGFFYDHVDQEAVNDIVFTGLANFTNQADWNNIWSVLFSKVNPDGYQPGQKIAIKVSFNNSISNNNTCAYHNNTIDALPQPMLALIGGMVAAGVQASDIILYDASGFSDPDFPKGKTIPDYFRNPILDAYPQVQFVGRADCDGVIAASHGKHPSLTVEFNDPKNQILDRALADVLFDATYLINIPIMKVHSGDDGMPVSLAMKNHCGTINYVYASSNTDSLHEYMELVGGAYFSEIYSPLVDVNNHPFIKGKTILIMGDCLFGAGNAAGPAKKTWAIYNGAPGNSMFFATDPIAADCVMTDLLREEFGTELDDPRVYSFLFCGQEAGLGICEGTRENPGGDPLQQPYGNGYSLITYIRQDI